MGEHVLITGGAGFIGSHVADELLGHGYTVRSLDNLSPQVHGTGGRRPAYLDHRVEFVVGDLRNPTIVREALHDVDAVLHLAAAVGVGQSMYEITHYTDNNNVGTAVLLEALMERPVSKLVAASSMSIYGEGVYESADGVRHQNVQRELRHLRQGQWEPLSSDATALSPLPTDENKQPSLSSVYALSKYDQEQLCLLTGRAYQIPTTALRFFNVYGTRQALQNPYTGVLAIFAARLLNGKAPQIYEDGKQRRDFVNVHDVATACRLALENSQSDGVTFNIGSGQAYTIEQLARTMAGVLGMDDITPDITQRYRVGDIRHCFADITKARTLLGFSPQWSLQDGLSELADWLRGQTVEDRFDMAGRELANRGLTL